MGLFYNTSGKIKNVTPYFSIFSYGILSKRQTRLSSSSVSGQYLDGIWLKDFASFDLLFKNKNYNPEVKFFSDLLCSPRSKKFDLSLQRDLSLKIVIPEIQPLIPSIFNWAHFQSFWHFVENSEDKIQDRYQEKLAEARSYLPLCQKFSRISLLQVKRKIEIATRTWQRIFLEKKLSLKKLQIDDL